MIDIDIDIDIGVARPSAQEQAIINTARALISPKPQLVSGPKKPQASKSKPILQALVS